MQSKITLKSVRRSFKTFMTLGLLLLIAGVLKAQPYINGPLSTGATSSGGNTAPAGFTWSELQGANTGYGSGANIGAGLTLADDFIVPAGQTWNTTKFTFYAYSTGATGATSPFNDIRVRIFNTNPSTGNPAPIFGNLTTNVFASSTTASMYRIAPGAVGTTRQIWKIEATIVTALTAGTYWVEWQNGTVVPNASNFSPAKTVLGTTTQPGNNALQHDLNANTWIPIVDAGPQDFPFQIDYTASGNPCAGTPAPGNTISTLSTVCPGTPFTLSLQNLTNGLGVTYQWQSAPSATGPWTNIAGATSPTYAVANLTTTTFYQAIVTCSGSNGTSTPVGVSLNPPSACYCTPASSDCTDADLILNVKFEALNNTTDCSPNGYGNYTTGVDTAKVIIGAGNPIVVTTGDDWTEQVGVWIDYNRSGSFEANEFTNLGSTPAGSGGVHTGNIVVPAGVAAGYTRMRVRDRFSTALAGGDACLGFVYGETEDYTINLIPCVPVSLTTQPVAATISCGGNATFSVTATGSLPAYQWQVRTSAAAPWTLVTNTGVYSGATTKTLNISNAPVSMNGYQYRVIFTGACNGPDFSTAATLTVNTFVLAVTPASGSICATGGTPILLTVPNNTTVSSFSNTTTGTIPDNSATGLVRNIDVSGVTGGVLSARVTFNIPHTWVGDLAIAIKAPNGQVMSLDYYLTGTGGAGATTGLINTALVSTLTAPLLNAPGGSPSWTGNFAADGTLAATIGLADAGPAGFTPTVGGGTAAWSALFVGGVNGTWSIGMRDGGAGDIGTFTSATISFTTGSAPATAVFTPSTGLFTNAGATTPYTGTAVSQVYAAPTATTTYSAIVSTATCTGDPQLIPITVTSPATSISVIANKSVCPLANTTFTGTVTGGSGVALQWQVSTDGGATFTNIANGGIYSGATTNTLTLTAVPQTQSGSQYRLVASAAPCTTGVQTSNAATLTVTPNPVLNLAAAPTTAVFPGITTSVVVAVNPAPSAGTTYTWFRNGVQVPGATSNTLAGLDVDDLGTYTVRVTDGNGCTSLSNAVTIVDSATTTLFIYPNPSKGQFHVRYHDLSTSPTFQGPRTLTIFDSKGSRVFYKTYSSTAPYSDMFVDLSNHGKGIYSVDLTDFNGNRIKTGRVLIQ